MIQSDLFGAESYSAEKVSLPDAEIRYIPDFLDMDSANSFFAMLYQKINWRQDNLVLYGKQVLIPRMHAWYGNKPYEYSGITMACNSWFEELATLRVMCEKECDMPFNAVLANLYRDGSDSVAMHADDEKELGPAPTIASISLGETRRFDFQHKTSKVKHNIELQHGSLLVMSGETQKFWLHGISKSKNATAPRINLTFRYML